MDNQNSLNPQTGTPLPVGPTLPNDAAPTAAQPVSPESEPASMQPPGVNELPATVPSSEPVPSLSSEAPVAAVSVSSSAPESSPISSALAENNTPVTTAVSTEVPVTTVPAVVEQAPVSASAPVEPAPGPTGPIVADIPNPNTAPGAAPTKATGKHKKLIAMVLIAVVTIMLAVAAYVLVSGKKATPQSVFDKALDTAWSTKTVVISEKIVSDSQSETVRATVDVSDIKNPKYTVKLEEAGEAGEWTYQNGLANMRLTSLSASGLNVDMSPILNKWIEIPSENDNKGDSGGFTKEQLSDLFVGEWFTGNFSSAQKSELKTTAVNKKVYEVTSKSLLSQSIAGTDTYVIDVDTNLSAVVELSKKAASYFGTTLSKSFQADVEGRKPTLKLYVDKKTYQVVKVAMQTSKGEDETMTLAEYNKPVTIEPAKRDLTFEQYQTEINKIFTKAGL